MSEFDNSNSSMLEMYLFETTSLLTQLDDILLDAEESSSLTTENINEIFRIMHTIKGSSAMMEYNIISSVSHKLEDLFYVIRDNGLDSDNFESLFDLVLKVSDFLKEEVEKIENGGALCQENDQLVNEILAFLEMLKNGHKEMEGFEAPPAAEDEEDSEALAAAILAKVAAEESGAAPAEAPAPAASAPAAPAASDDAQLGADEKLYHIHATFAVGCQMENIRAFMLVDKLNTVGRVIKTNPENLDTNPDASAIIVDNGFFCSLVSSKSEAEIIAVGKTAPSVEVVEFADSLGKKQSAPAPAPEAGAAAAKTEAPAAKAEAPAASAPAAKAAAPQADAAQGDGGGSGGASHKPNLISVDLYKLDALMDLVGELVIAESMVTGNPDLTGLKLENFEKAASQLHKLTSELQDISMSIRMVPISGTFQKMKRIVRDMSKKLDKEAELVLMGETTEVDKTIVDAIADPIMHLVRNSMDHGIEDKEERAETSKDPKARIILSAQNLGGDIIIAVSDDGRGLDAEKILAKAKSKGILTKPEAEMTEKEIFNLLMAPGFSTKDAVTEYSGRGVGMDVVKKNIEKIGGTVTIESVKGHGMTVYFKIPLTLAIIDSMEIRVGKSIYTIPITNIRESFKPDPSQAFADPEGNEMIMIRGACYPIVRLNRLFKVPDSVDNLEDGILLLVDSGERLACVLADELIGKHEVVVKPMPSYINHLIDDDIGISGCTIMGNGSISLILDMNGVLSQY